MDQGVTWTHDGVNYPLQFFSLLLGSHSIRLLPVATRLKDVNDLLSSWGSVLGPAGLHCRECQGFHSGSSQGTTSQAEWFLLALVQLRTMPGPDCVSPKFLCWHSNCKADGALGSVIRSWRSHLLWRPQRASLSLPLCEDTARSQQSALKRGASPELGRVAPWSRTSSLQSREQWGSVAFC